MARRRGKNPHDMSALPCLDDRCPNNSGSSVGDYNQQTSKCRFFLHKSCVQCTCGHSGPVDDEEDEHQQGETETKTWTRDFKGVSVTFGSGAEVKDVTESPEPPECPLLQLNYPKLAADSPDGVPKWIRCLLKPVKRSKLYTSLATAEKQGSAVLEFDKPENATKLYRALAKKRLKGWSIRSVEAAAVNGSRILSNQAVCQWVTPTRKTAYIYYDSEHLGIAEQVAYLFNTGRYQVQDQEVDSEVIRSDDGWMVRLRAISVRASEHDVLSNIPVLLRPRRFVWAPHQPVLRTVWLKLTTAHFTAVEREIQRLPVHVEQHQTMSPESTIISIEGIKTEDVVMTKKRISGMLHGKVILDEGQAAWSTAFEFDGCAYDKIKQLASDLGIGVVRDTRRSEIRVFGTKEKCAEAQSFIIKIARDSRNDFKLGDAGPVLRGGLRAIAAAVGAGKVQVNKFSSPDCFELSKLNGTDEELEIAREILAEKCKALVSKPGSTAECSICWTEADNPVWTSCGHVYCSGCFENLCLHGVKDNACIRCHGDGGNCCVLLRLDEVEDQLGPAKYEEILEAAFNTYLNRHAKKFAHCPTRDCGMIYEVFPPPEAEGDAPLFQCPGCLTSICRSCHSAHEDITCAEQRILAAGGDVFLSRWKKELGIKDCPGCGASIQKNAGCNKIACRNCKTHICWVCMQTFEDPQECYKHMQREHGGIGPGNQRYYPELA